MIDFNLPGPQAGNAFVSKKCTAITVVMHCGMLHKTFNDCYRAGAARCTEGGTER